MARYRFKQIRLLVNDDLALGRVIDLVRDQAHYLITVMRLKDGAEILVFNGRDGEWTGQIEQKSRRACQLRITGHLREQAEHPTLTYCFAPLKQARLDYMAQKAVEMGAGVLQPVMTRHTQVQKLNLERIRANVIEACEQCGVLAIPDVREAVTLKDLVETWSASGSAGRIIFCDEGATGSNPIDRLMTLKPAPTALLIGPEGGFSDDERDLLTGSEAVVAIPLGPRILRADTAAVAALAVIQATIGDWRDEPDNDEKGRDQGFSHS